MKKFHPVSKTRVTGFEPVNNGTKIRCLSIWRYPYTRVAQTGNQSACATAPARNFYMGNMESCGIPLYAKRSDRYCLNLIVKRVCLICVYVFYMFHGI